MSLTFTKGADSVILSSPDFGDSHMIDPAVTVQFTRSNIPTIVKDPMWPDQIVKDYDIGSLSSTVLKQLEDFIRLYAGQTITVTDYDSTEYDAYLLNAEYNIVTERDDCSHAIKIRLLVKE